MSEFEHLMVEVGFSPEEAAAFAKVRARELAAQKMTAEAKARIRHVAALCRTTGNWQRAESFIASGFTLREAQVKLKRTDEWTAVAAKAWAARRQQET